MRHKKRVRWHSFHFKQVLIVGLGQKTLAKIFRTELKNPPIQLKHPPIWRIVRKLQQLIPKLNFIIIFQVYLSLGHDIRDRFARLMFFGKVWEDCYFILEMGWPTMFPFTHQYKWWYNSIINIWLFKPLYIFSSL